MRGLSSAAAGVTNPYLIGWDVLEATQWQKLLDTLAPWTELYPEIEGDLLRETGGCACRASCSTPGPQLVVVGDRGRNMLADTLLGTASLDLLNHSPVPVMLCHKRSDDR